MQFWICFSMRGLARRVHGESHCNYSRLELYLPSLGNVKMLTQYPQIAWEGCLGVRRCHAASVFDISMGHSWTMHRYLKITFVQSIYNRSQTKDNPVTHGRCCAGRRHRLPASPPLWRRQDVALSWPWDMGMNHEPLISFNEQINHKNPFKWGPWSSSWSKHHI